MTLLILNASGDIYLRLKADVTPEAYLIDSNDQIIYRGRINNQFVLLAKQRTQITTNDLQDALNILINYQAIPVQYQKPIGCIAPNWEQVNKQEGRYDQAIAFREKAKQLLPDDTYFFD